MNHPWLETPWDHFAARLEQDRLPHALLLCGPPGLGKRALADAMVAGLLCLSGAAEACGECRSCALLGGGAHPDRFVIEPEEGKRVIKVDAVRELTGRLALTTTISPRKVALLAPAEAMNTHAANALLKNLEEPPGDTVLLLLSHDPSRLPITIRSRCQAVNVATPPRAAALEWLRAETGLDAATAKLALEAAGGSPLRAASLSEEDTLVAFRELRGRLQALIGKPSQAGAGAADLESMDGSLAWSWLSLFAGRALADVLQVSEDAWPQTAYTLPPAKLSQLQAKADRNRALLSSTVRQDLLLKEWLLEWARLPAKEPIR